MYKKFIDVTTHSRHKQTHASTHSFFQLWLWFSFVCVSIRACQKMATYF